MRCHATTVVSALGWAAVVAAGAAGACASIPPERRARVREQGYRSTHPELPPRIDAAIAQGHVLVGMDSEQVWVVLGEPVARRAFGGVPPLAAWIYPASRLQQGHAWSGAGALVRIVFSDDRVVTVEPF